MCQMVPVSRRGFYRSLKEQQPAEEEMEVQSAIQQIALLRCSPSFGPIFGLLKVDRCLQLFIDRSLLSGLWEL